ncbi:ABC transporter substrate-binding protein [Streptomyces sp. SL13]|jgi:polar amino acid transport system substrate-binding protein|uniref:ABC transporter substrate-binding protein n=1 Tax=Streptantibioticus silvisoli TaxID=2705255 RepID=A0AA90HCY5_9ACTN|nr:ABC transporter substrate-binding protein [Streptantibioticus silvisoli]MDI5965601.1 ABC transporter substrate-binding protein [Streptantibioticus silvisoli]MDI5972622.1 ABC transporter substrate-binding protein [Streptantibioticus silvisoli]
MPNALASSGSRLAAVAVTALFLTAVGCAPQPDGSAAPGHSTTAAAGTCTPGALPTLTGGRLTIGTDNPAYAPWFTGNDPANGKGFESAVAYAVAKRLGYPAAKVTWTKVPFNSVIAPGAKRFDFDLDQVSISTQRKAAVDFSSGYYDVQQALVAMKGSKLAGAHSLADLKHAKLGAQIGTTSLDVLRDDVRPDRQPAVYQSNDLAKAALKDGQVDGIIMDLPTAFYVTSAEVTDAKVVGQFADSGGKPEQFGLVLDKGSRLTGCVTRAVDQLRADGTLAALDKRWLSDAVHAPVLK